MSKPTLVCRLVAAVCASFATVTFLPSASAQQNDSGAATQASGGSEKTPVKMTGRDVVRVRFINMLQLNPDISAARVATQSTEFGRDAAMAGFYPKLSVGANANSSSTINNRQSTDVTVRQPLYSGGRLTARLRQAEVDAQLSFSNLDRITQDTVLEGLVAHVQLQRQALLVKAAKGGLDAVNDLLKLEERRLELGGGGITDAQFAKARGAVAADRLATFEGQLDEARAAYLRFFYQISDPLQLPELDVSSKLLNGTMEELVRRALEINPQISQTEMQITRARFNYEAEFAALYPTVELVGVQQFFKERDPFTGREQDSSINVRFNYAAFSGGEQTARIGRAAADVDAQRVQQISARLKVEEGVRLQYSRRVAAMNRAKTLEAATDDALSVFRNRKRLRDFGRETAIAMLDAQVEYFNVLIAYLNAVFDARIANLRLLHAVGEMRPSADPAPWLENFYSRSSERVKLERRLKASEDVARERTERSVADELGIQVDPESAERAGRYFLSPDTELKMNKRSGKAPPVSTREQTTTPALRYSTDIAPAR
jgi:outer membrane protein TolC